MVLMLNSPVTDFHRMTDEELEEYIPKPRPSPFAMRYAGGGDMVVVQSFDGDEVLFSAGYREPEISQQEGAVEEAVDALTEMDFMATMDAEELSLNEGEVAFVSWNGSSFVQDRKIIPAATVVVEEDEDPQYVHLIVPMQYYAPQSLTEGPWVRRDETLSSFPFTPYSYAETTEWQGVHEITEPSYLVSADETLTPEEDFFKCLICTVTAGDVEQNHAGAITLPQGYIAGLDEV